MTDRKLQVAAVISAFLAAGLFGTDAALSQPDSGSVVTRGSDSNWQGNLKLPGMPSDGYISKEIACSVPTLWTHIEANKTADIAASSVCKYGDVTPSWIAQPGCATDCCAAWSSIENAGKLCVGTHCAFGVSGTSGGEMCMGESCASNASNGCPVSTSGTTTSSCLFCDDAWSTVDYGNCCAKYLAQACIGKNCGRYCSGDYCGRYCIGENCARESSGYQAGAQCQGDHCARDCVGVECGLNCWGDSCAHGGRGLDAGKTCTGLGCARSAVGEGAGSHCIGGSCAAHCSGNGCGNYCMEDSCAFNCTGKITFDTVDTGLIPCGVSAWGPNSASHCSGHGCGKHCSGENCAAHASSDFTETTFSVGSNPLTTQHVMSCHTKWLFNVYGMDSAQYIAATSGAPTSAPTYATAAPVTAAPTGVPTVATAAPSSAPSPAVTVSPSFAPTYLPTYAPASRISYVSSVGYADNATCGLVYTPGGLLAGGSNSFQNVEGPGHYCAGTTCAQYSKGAFAGSFCYGEGCAFNSTGFGAGIGCTGTGCAENARGDMAGAFCYGTRCAMNANSGVWAGTHCIGNECALGVTSAYGGSCCVGKNCHNSTVTATSCANEGDGGTPLNLGNTSIFRYTCRRHIDTESSAWIAFFNGCGAGSDYAGAPYSPTSSCTITCTEPLSQYLRYYRRRQTDLVYADLRIAGNNKYRNYVGSGTGGGDDDAKNTVIAVLASIIGVAGLIGIALAAKHFSAGSGSMTGIRANFYESVSGALQHM